jgi:hypothetical protein
MKMRVLSVALFSPLLLALSGGCVTKALWDNGDLEACKEPANKLNLRLFEGNSRSNLLVLYDESSERSGAVHTRAYWLKENEGLVEEEHVHPHFTSTRSKDHLPVVPVFYGPIPAGTALPPGLCAVLATNRQSFTLYWDNYIVSSHVLPVYNDGKGRIEKIALTPLAVGADLTVIPGIIFSAWCNSPDVQDRLDRGEYVPIWIH